jgi:glycine/D-amino acid oxidase-like deaminating enzyme
MKNWGNRPWKVEFRAEPGELPAKVEYAVVGGGFSGLAAAAWLKKLAPEKSVALLEAEEFGAGASGHTGGMALAETAAGDLPGLGDVLAGYKKILRELEVDGDLTLPGVYELGRRDALAGTPIRWKDSGDLCAVKGVEGGTINPGKVVGGLARAGARNGALLYENAGVERAEFAEEVRLETKRGSLCAKKVLFATNAYSLEMTGLQERAESTFTLAAMTSELSEEVFEEIGLGEGKPFYTVDLPYLWGRPLDRALIFGCGLVHVKNWRELQELDIERGEAPEMFARLEKRVNGLHPALQGVKFTHRWGGPICISDEVKPVFEQHPESGKAIVLGAFSGHGVAQSVYLGAWAAEAMLGRRELPEWRSAKARKE